MEDGIKHYQRILSTLYCETVDLKDVRAKARNAMFEVRSSGHPAKIDDALRIGDLNNRHVRRHAQTICHLAGHFSIAKSCWLHCKIDERMLLPAIS